MVLAVTATGREAEDLTEALRAFLPADAVAEFPSWETLPHERLSPRSDTVGRRLSVLRRLAHPETSASGALRVVVAPVRAVVQPIVAGLGELVPVTLKVGQEVPFSDVVRSLADAAYARVDMVTRRGEFAVRGGMLDVFPPTEDHPIRVEFFGDEVDQMRWFAVADQRSLTAPGVHHPTELHAPPCREILITPSVMSRAATLKSQLAGRRGHAGEDRRRHRRRRHGVAGPGAGGRHGAVPGPVPGRFHRGGDRTGEGPDPRPRPRRHQRGIPRGGVVHGVRRRHSAAGLEFRGVGGPALGQLPFADRNPLRRPRARVSWWSITSLATDEELLPDVDVLNLHAREPRGYQGDVAEMMDFIGSHVRGPVADRRRHRGPRPGPAARRTLPRQRHPLRPGRLPRRRPAGRADRGDHGRRRPRFCPGAAQARPADRG